jgi:hypothetical protein
VFCIYLKTNSDLCHLHHKLIGFYNRDEKYLQRGMDWVFKYSGLGFVFKGLSGWSMKQTSRLHAMRGLRMSGFSFHSPCTLENVVHLNT